MLPSFCVTQVTRYRAPLVDSRGTKVRDWAHKTSMTIDGCNIQRTVDNADINGRENTRDNYTLFAPPGADVAFMDRIDDGNLTYSVVESPYDWVSPSGSVSHLVATLEVLDG
ncbi:MAG: hypothetical protein IKD70_05720 [Eggerthellaceae bacterium]|nr:hypothetical protein [Eggerthellaceae bacterium]